jgi:hypothetical protein
MTTAKKVQKSTETDPYADWSDDEKAEWDASTRQRERLKAEMSDGIVDKLKDLLFSEEEGGEVTDDEATDDGTGMVEEVKKAVPFWDRQLFGKKGA